MNTRHTVLVWMLLLFIPRTFEDIDDDEPIFHIFPLASPLPEVDESRKSSTLFLQTT